MATPEASTALTSAQEAFGKLLGRSPLLGWMRQHHALITERMNTVRPSWDDIARTLAELGVRDANGQPPKTEAVRRAYHRVAGALNAKGQRRRRSKAQIAAAKAAASPLVPIAPAFDPTEGAFDVKPPPRFKPASLK